MVETMKIVVTSFKRSSGHSTNSVPWTFAASHHQPTLPPESTIALTSHASKVMLKILQVRLQQYMNLELQDIQAGFRKGRGTREQIANICWIIEKAREFQKNSTYALLTMPKPLTCVDHNKLWKILQEMGIPDHVICLLRSLYAGQEAIVKTGHETMGWFQIGIAVHRDCTLSLPLI